MWLAFLEPPANKLCPRCRSFCLLPVFYGFPNVKTQKLASLFKDEFSFSPTDSRKSGRRPARNIPWRVRVITPKKRLWHRGFQPAHRRCRLPTGEKLHRCFTPFTRRCTQRYLLVDNRAIHFHANLIAVMPQEVVFDKPTPPNYGKTVEANRHACRTSYNRAAAEYASWTNPIFGAGRVRPSYTA